MLVPLIQYTAPINWHFGWSGSKGDSGVIYWEIRFADSLLNAPPFRFSHVIAAAMFRVWETQIVIESVGINLFLDNNLVGMGRWGTLNSNFYLNYLWRKPCICLASVTAICHETLIVIIVLGTATVAWTLPTGSAICKSITASSAHLWKLHNVDHIDFLFEYSPSWNRSGCCLICYLSLLKPPFD